MLRVLFLTRSMIIFQLLWVAPSFGQPSILYSNGAGEIYSFDPLQCESTHLFKVNFPDHFGAQEAFISGLALDRAGNIMAVNGTHLMYIDSTTGNIQIIDSIEARDQLGEWLSIAMGHDGTLYLGTHGFYTYDLSKRKIISKPELYYGFLLYFGGDMGWYDTYLLNYSRFFHLIGLHDPLDQELAWHVEVPIRDAFFGITSVFTDCDQGSIYGFRADTSMTMVMRFRYGESEYDTICTISEGVLFGMTSMNEHPQRGLSVVGDQISVDSYGNNRVLVSARCSDTLAGILDVEIEKCYPIDSVVFSSDGGAAILGSNLENNKDGHFLWTNGAEWDDARISDWMNDLRFVLTQPKSSYRIYVGIYSQGFRSALNIEIDRDIYDCFEEGRDLYIPNAFTPNGDGINDFFEVYLSDHIYILDFRIYSPYSQLVYQLEDNTSVSWSGRGLNAGVFIYTGIFKDELTQQIHKRHGSIHLIK